MEYNFPVSLLFSCIIAFALCSSARFSDRTDTREGKRYDARRLTYWPTDSSTSFISFSVTVEISFLATVDLLASANGFYRFSKKIRFGFGVKFDSVAFDGNELFINQTIAVVVHFSNLSLAKFITRSYVEKRTNVFQHTSSNNYYLKLVSSEVFAFEFGIWWEFSSWSRDYTDMNIICYNWKTCIFLRIKIRVSHMRRVPSNDY